ncbi:MAG TPA: hypothetical protein PKH07_14090, partial [bacterium]|nr:hypothetical protein [bacterium]
MNHPTTPETSDSAVPEFNGAVPSDGLRISTYRPRIAFGAGYQSFVDLPTGGLEWRETYCYELEQTVPPGSVGSVVTGFRKGVTSIVIQGEIQADDPESVATTLSGIESAVACGAFRLFSHYSPDDGVYRYYQDCYATKFISDLRAGDPHRPGRNTRYELHLIATDPSVQGTEPSEDSNLFVG